jgi:hypothetical protein
MPRHGVLTNEEKARAVLTRTGQPGNRASALDEADQLRLADIYDHCIAPELGLKDAIREFWGQREQRLAAAKATDEAQDKAHDAGLGITRNATPPAGEASTEDAAGTAEGSAAQ